MFTADYGSMLDTVVPLSLCITLICILVLYCCMIIVLISTLISTYMCCIIALGFAHTLVLIVQVAALAPLALLLVLEARCAHFVIAHFNYCVLRSSASLAPTQHIYKLVSEIIVFAMGVVPMSKVEGSWICYQV